VPRSRERLLRTDAGTALGVVPVGRQRFCEAARHVRPHPARAVARIVTAQSRRFDAGPWLGECSSTAWASASVRGRAARNRMPHLRGFFSYLSPSR